MHALNNCSVSLKTNRYTWCHNSVQAAVVEYIERYLADSRQITADLPGRVYSLPSDIGDMSARPDIVAWSQTHKQIVIFKLTILFEEILADAARRKQDYYAPLCNQISSLGWWTKLNTIEVGSRGLLNIPSLDQ